jgi:nucleotide-binding universal stress UspA family protein
MYDRILVPVDGSDCSRRAVTYGAGVASACGADLDLVHVLEGRGFLRSVFGDDERERRRSRARELLEAAADLVGPDVAVDTHLLEGDAAESVLGAADDRGADLVVLGKSGRGGVRRRLLGSVSTAVLRHADVPVLVVPDGDVDPDPAVEDVLVPTDGSECAGRAVDHGGAVTSTFGSVLHLLTVVDVSAAAGPFDAGGVDAEYVDRLLDRGEGIIEAAADRAGDGDVRTAVVRGRAGEGILSYVDENGVDLVVMGSRGRSNVQRRLLGSVTERVVREGAVPVLVVR